MLNSAYGYTCPPPVLIGHVQRAKEVIATGEDKPFLEITTFSTSTVKLGLSKGELINQQ